MLTKLIKSPLRRGSLGALVGAVLPFALDFLFTGIQWATVVEYLSFYLAFGGMFGLLFFGICYGGGNVGGQDSDLGPDSVKVASEADHNDLVNQTGIYTSMRDQWDLNYK